MIAAILNFVLSYFLFSAILAPYDANDLSQAFALGVCFTIGMVCLMTETIR